MANLVLKKSKSIILGITKEMEIAQRSKHHSNLLFQPARSYSFEYINMAATRGNNPGII